MDEQTILNALALGEERDWEFKSAKGGIPGSLWETYSAMANTDGGCIVLGVEERGGGYVVSGLDDPAKVRKSFWDTINNPSKVNVNLLTEEQVRVQNVAGKAVLVVHVPRAARRQRPIYVGQNPLDGTYRRSYEADYRCRRDEVGRMLGDQSEEPFDSQILEGFGIGDLDAATVRQYRNRLAARSPDHPWLGLKQRGFLEKLGAIRAGRRSESEGLTVAGLLMFGKDEAICDPEAVPGFNLDYRERLSDDPAVRWTDRVTFDGTWVANIFQFYQRVAPKLTADLKMPFRLDANMVRAGDTIVHQAVREALVNALVHADYRGQGGVVAEKYRDRFEISNPGTLLVSVEQILRGGVSECRNQTIQKMFLMIGSGERAGSGFDKIRQGWASQNWRLPRIEETMRPDRVRLVLSMVSMLPEESLRRLAERFGRRFVGLGPLEVQALVTAEVEGEVSNSRMRQISEEHPADLTKTLQGLVAGGFLEQVGQKRGTFYRLAKEPEDSAHMRGDSAHMGRDSAHMDEDSAHRSEGPIPDADPALLAIAEPARRNRRMAPDRTRAVLHELCKGRFLTLRQISTLLDRHPNTVRSRFVTPMVKEGQLRLRFPEEPNRPDQAYAATEQEKPS